MSIEEWVQYGSMVIAVTALIIKRTGMKEFVPVGLFASFYANLWCAVAATYHWWHFPSRIVTAFEDISIPANFVVVPIMAWCIWALLLPVTEIIYGLYSAFTGYTTALPRAWKKL